MSPGAQCSVSRSPVSPGAQCTCLQELSANVSRSPCSAGVSRSPVSPGAQCLQELSANVSRSPCSAGVSRSPVQESPGPLCICLQEHCLQEPSAWIPYLIVPPLHTAGQAEMRLCDKEKISRLVLIGLMKRWNNQIRYPCTGLLETVLLETLILITEPHFCLSCSILTHFLLSSEEPYFCLLSSFISFGDSLHAGHLQFVVIRCSGLAHIFVNL